MADAMRSAWHPPFRGQIYEYAAKLNLQAGYAVKGPVDINTLRHLIEPLQAIRDPGVRIVDITGAVQTTKSLVADIFVPYIIEHDPGDTLWLLEDEPKARLYAERALSLIRSVPEIAAMLEVVDRNDKTKTEIKFAHMKLVICGLNAGNVQSLSWRNVIVDEKWLHPFDGLIRQAMDRAKQYPATKKILLIGQGGVEDDDPDVEHKQSDQRLLHYACPHCLKFQPFELGRQRPDDFVLEKLRGKYAGLSWDTNETTRPNGRWNWEEVGKTAHHRCFYCDHRIEDTPDIRRQLNDSYCYFPAATPEKTKLEASARYKLDGTMPTPAPFPERVGFDWPGEASMRVPFRELATKYLRAKIAAEELAYRLPLKEYYQKDRGITWSETIDAEFRATTQEAYDPKAKYPDENFRTLIADCQRDLKKFFVGVWSVALSGDTRELAREEVASFDAIAAIQKEWKVPDQRVFLDCGYEMNKVLRECVKRGHVGTIKIAGKPRKVWLCWTGLKGSGVELFRHTNPNTKLVEYKIFSERKFFNVNVGTKDRQPRAPWYEWSNLHCKDLLRARRDAEPGAPKFLTLPDTLPATDQNSNFAQMRSERRAEEYTARGKRSIWKSINENNPKPNHRWDIGAMLMAVQGVKGVIGSPDEAEPKAENA